MQAFRGSRRGYFALMLWIGVGIVVVLVVVAVKTTSMILRGCVLAAIVAGAGGGGVAALIGSGLNAVHGAFLVNPHDLASRNPVATLPYPGARLETQSFVTPSGSVQTAVHDVWQSDASGSDIAGFYALHLDARTWPIVRSCSGDGYTEIHFLTGNISWSNGVGDFTVAEDFTVIVAGHAAIPGHTGAPTPAPTPTAVTLLPFNGLPTPAPTACAGDRYPTVPGPPPPHAYETVLTAGPPQLTF